MKQSETTPVTVPEEQREDKWIREMAAKEDGCFVNIGSPLEHVMLTRTIDHEGIVEQREDIPEAQPGPALNVTPTFGRPTVEEQNGHPEE